MGGTRKEVAMKKREPKTMSDADRMDANLAKLPKAAYAILPASGKPIAVRRGVMGYFEAYLEPGQTIDSLNEGLGVTKAQAKAMLHGSIFGWHTPAADPDVCERDGLA
jgi:hypothetical protein